MRGTEEIATTCYTISTHLCSSLVLVGEISVPRPIGLPRTVFETTGNEIPARPYTLPLFLKHTFCWENYTFPGLQSQLMLPPR